MLEDTKSYGQEKCEQEALGEGGGYSFKRVNLPKKARFQQRHKGEK